MIEAAGWEHGYAQQIACPYISAARANMTRAALDVKPTKIVYLDYDLSWDAPDLLTLIETEGDCVAGTYRAKIDDEQYMGQLEVDPVTFQAMGRKSDGALLSKLIPAGFLSITPEAIDTFMVAYPELCYGPMYHLSIDIFNHGADDRVWWGEDYAFSRRFRAKCGPIWTVPNLNITHWNKEKDADGNMNWKPYHGNLHKFLMRQPGGMNGTV